MSATQQNPLYRTESSAQQHQNGFVDRPAEQQMPPVDHTRAPEIVAHESEADPVSPADPPVYRNGNGAPMTVPPRRLFEGGESSGPLDHQQREDPRHWTSTQNSDREQASVTQPTQSPFIQALSDAVRYELQAFGQSVVGMLGNFVVTTVKRLGHRGEVKFKSTLPLWKMPQLLTDLSVDCSFGYAARCFATICEICACEFEDPIGRVSHAVGEQEKALRDQWQGRDRTALLLELSKKTELERDILDAASRAIEHHRMMVRFRKSSVGDVRGALAFLFDEGGEDAAREFAVPRMRATGLFSGPLESPPSAEEVVAVLRKRRRGIDATWAK